MADNSRFDFCPKCGALARDGVCQSCGYQDPEIVKAVEEQKQREQMQNTQHMQNYQQMQNNQHMQNYQQMPNQGYQQMPNPGYQQGYQTAQNYSPIPSENPRNKAGKNGLIICVVLGVILALIVGGVGLLYLLAVNVYGTFSDNKVENESFLDEDGNVDWNKYFDIFPEDDMDSDSDSNSGEDMVYQTYSTNTTEINRNEEGQDESYPYYSGPYNDLKDDLSYQVEFYKDIFTAESSGSVYIEVEYPQITMENKTKEEEINTSLRYEFDFFVNVFEEDYKNYMNFEEDFFYIFADANVTYMDENILSVVFSEEVSVYIAEQWISYVNYYCLNFDMQTGMLLMNNEILNLDEAFALDFRQREIAENGDEALTDYTDQEILEMLKDESTLVLFYTPRGLEVGLNLDSIIVYVQYEDYQKYLNKN